MNLQVRGCLLQVKVDIAAQVVHYTRYSSAVQGHRYKVYVMHYRTDRYSARVHEVQYNKCTVPVRVVSDSEILSFAQNSEYLSKTLRIYSEILSNLAGASLLIF